MAAPVRIDELTAGGSLSAGAAVAVVQSNDTLRTTPRAFITEAESFTQAGSGAVARTVQSKSRDVLSAFDFMTASEIADVQAYNYPDVTAAVQAAWDTGHPVFHPAGGYGTSATLTMSGVANIGQRIFGSGCVRQDLGTGTNKTIFKPTSAVSSAIAMVGSGTSVRGALLADFSIDMTNMTDASTRIGVRTNTAFENKIRNITCINQGSNKRTFKFEAGSYLTIIENCRGTLVELSGNSLADAVTTLMFMNCDFDQYIMSNSAAISVIGGAVQGSIDKFVLSDTEGLAITHCDIEGTGVFLNIGSGVTNLTQHSNYLNAFSGTFRSGTWTTQNGLYYQRGTWTPTLLINGSATGITYNNQAAAYTRVGDMVHCLVDVILASKGASVGAVTMSGLPFVSDANYNQDFAVNLQNSTYTGDPTGRVGPSASTISFQITNAGSQGSLADTNLGNTSIIRFTFSYKCA